MNWSLLLLLLLLLSIIALLNSNSKMILLVHSIPAALVGSFGSVLAKLKHRKMNKIIIFERNVHAYALCVYVCTTYTAFCLFLFSHSRETSYKMVLWIPLWKWVKAKGILQTKVWILDLNIKCVQATLHTHTVQNILSLMWSRNYIYYFPFRYTCPVLWRECGRTQHRSSTFSGEGFTWSAFAAERWVCIRCLPIDSYQRYAVALCFRALNFLHVTS